MTYCYLGPQLPCSLFCGRFKNPFSEREGCKWPAAHNASNTDRRGAPFETNQYAVEARGAKKFPLFSLHVQVSHGPGHFDVGPSFSSLRPSFLVYRQPSVAPAGQTTLSPTCLIACKTKADLGTLGTERTLTERPTPFQSKTRTSADRQICLNRAAAQLMAPAVLSAALCDAFATAAFVFISSIWDEVGLRYKLPDW